MKEEAANSESTHCQANITMKGKVRLHLTNGGRGSNGTRASLSEVQRCNCKCVDSANLSNHRGRQRTWLRASPHGSLSHGHFPLEHLFHHIHLRLNADVDSFWKWPDKEKLMGLSYLHLSFIPGTCA